MLLLLLQLWRLTCFKQVLSPAGDLCLLGNSTYWRLGISLLEIPGITPLHNQSRRVKALECSKALLNTEEQQLAETEGGEEQDQRLRLYCKYSLESLSTHDTGQKASILPFHSSEQRRPQEWQKHIALLIKQFSGTVSGSQLFPTLVPPQQVWQRHWQEHWRPFLPSLCWTHESPCDLQQHTEHFLSRRHINSLALHLTGASVLGQASISLLVWLVFSAIYPATSNGTNSIKSCSHPCI